jgi:regulator of nucleoside diphosphate kinase
MTRTNELLVSALDAEALAPIVGDRRRTDRFEADAADALAEVLMDARKVPHDRLPADRVAINSRVTYRAEPRGEARTVVLAHPSDANASEGRISVLSPVGRALLGRNPGAVSSIGVPGGRAVAIRVLDVAVR